LPRYVAFFSSINVGRNRLTMADLRAAFETEGFAAVETVVASGNVLFDHPERPSAGLEEKLGLMMRERFGLGSFAAVRGRDELAEAIDDNPFSGIGEDRHVHTLFLDGPLSDESYGRLVEAHEGSERLAPGGRELYVDFAGGVASSRLSGSFIERKLGRRATARNVRSLARVLAKLDEGG
jgi:uncharacterized protein (DUF1697 family)